MLVLHEGSAENSQAGLRTLLGIETRPAFAMHMATLPAVL